ncbi:YdcH family protein [Burkholderiales bacterium]|nr:YdcH family protein [Burkholderiales bacterium]
MVEIFDSISIVKNKIAALKEEHRDLDEAVTALNQSHQPDELQIRRMKKRKLLLKDQILQLQKMLVPDVPA